VVQTLPDRRPDFESGAGGGIRLSLNENGRVVRGQIVIRENPHSPVSVPRRLFEDFYHDEFDGEARRAQDGDSNVAVQPLPDNQSAYWSVSSDGSIVVDLTPLVDPSIEVNTEAS